MATKKQQEAKQRASGLLAGLGVKSVKQGSVPSKTRDAQIYRSNFDRTPVPSNYVKTGVQGSAATGTKFIYSPKPAPKP
ncbi:MAG: hypothetical protein ACO4B5_11480, partial [Steroidobacteraceae bacterium]